MKTYLDFFEEISAVPRMSGHEEIIADYLVDFAKTRNLIYYRDEINNVIIWKDASDGYEDRNVLALQSHIDMICEKIPESNHDFLRNQNILGASGKEKENLVVGNIGNFSKKQ